MNDIELRLECLKLAASRMSENPIKAFNATADPMETALLDRDMCNLADAYYKYVTQQAFDNSIYKKGKMQIPHGLPIEIQKELLVEFDTNESIGNTITFHNMTARDAYVSTKEQFEDAKITAIIRK